MAENDDAVLTAAVGYVYVGAAGTAAPSPALLKTIDLSKPETWTGATGWTSVGHTSRGTLPEFGFEGGESEVKGSWQKKKLREITTEDPIDYVTVLLHQFDEQSLGLYYGPNASDTPGVFGVKTGQTNEKAVLVVIEDGDMRLGHHAHKAGVRRDDAIELPIDDLAALPVRFTYLDHEDELPFSWINEDLFNVPQVPEG
ncbi:major tail protein [Mycobacterium phage Serenity]|uniref:major tail protein n=1 Tax=Mycobacterium phage Serenity TaxID=1701853 RepID=UPI0006CE316E|nr:major tail protein [Mycobacterium phage Serenity]ALF00890.1 major tail protein [Mycobacterium phage Serenity]ATN92152.1 major tail protein [Mycobacterium phage TipsytheTRex]